MRLPDYIKEVGLDKFSKRVGVKKRTALSWQRMERRPRPAVAQRIIERTPVTMEGIYGV